MRVGGWNVMSAEAINSSYAVPMTNGVNQTNPRADSRDVSLHPMTNKPPNQGRLFYWLAVWLILIPPIVVRVVVGVRDPDGVWEGRD